MLVKALNEKTVKKSCCRGQLDTETYVNCYKMLLKFSKFYYYPIAPINLKVVSYWISRTSFLVM